MRVTGSCESIRRFERVLKVFLGFWMVQGVSDNLGGVLGGLGGLGKFSYKKIDFWWGHIISYIQFYNPIIILNPRQYLGIII